MNARTTGALLLVVAGLGALVWLTGREDGPKGNPQQPVLAGSALSDCVHLRWQLGPGAPVIELRREAQGPFRIVEPIVDLASRARIQALASAYDSAMMAEAFPREQVDDKLLGELGLQTPRATFAATFGDGRQVELRIGAEGPLGGDTFLLRDGVVYRGGLALFTSLQMNLDDLRERQVFQNAPATATMVLVQQRGADSVVERLRLRRLQRGWKLEEPFESRTELGPAETFVSLLLGLRIDQFQASVVRFPDRDPDLLIDVEGAFGAESVRLWRDQGDNLIGDLRSRQISFVSLDTQYHQIFGNAVDQLRARWLIPIDDLPRDLMRVVIAPGASAPRAVIERDNADRPFGLREPVVAAAAPTPVAELIQAINNLRVLRHVEGEPQDPRFGLQPGGLAIDVQAFGSTGGTGLRFGADDRLGELEVTYAVRGDEPGQVVAVPKPAVDKLRRRWQDYLDRQVVRLDAVVEMVRAERGDTVREFRLVDGRWRRDGEDAPQDWVGGLVDELRDLRGQGADSAARLDLGEPDASVALCRRNGDQFLRLLLWDRGPSQPMRVRLATSPDLVHELNDFVGDYLRRLWQ